MRSWAALFVAACLAGAAAADFAPPTCGGAGVPGGWSAMSAEDATAAAQEIVDQFLGT